MRSSRLLLALSLTIVAVAMAGWVVVSVGDLHDRLAKHSPYLAVAFATLAGVGIFVFSITAARLFWKLGRSERAPAKAPADVIRAAEIQVENAERVVAQIGNDAARDR